MHYSSQYYVHTQTNVQIFGSSAVDSGLQPE